MQILKSGKPWSVEVECTGNGNGGQGCGALLEAEREDMRFYEGTDYPVYRPSAVSIRCPECGKITDLPTSQWPTGARTLEPYTSAWSNGLAPPAPQPPEAS